MIRCGTGSGSYFNVLDEREMSVSLSVYKVGREGLVSVFREDYILFWGERAASLAIRGLVAVLALFSIRRCVLYFDEFIDTRLFFYYH